MSGSEGKLQIEPEPTAYGAWFGWAYRMTKAGWKQRLCKKCERWHIWEHKQSRAVQMGVCIVDDKRKAR